MNKLLTRKEWLASLQKMIDEFDWDAAFNQPPKEPQCNLHPKAPHGLMREASYQANRYVCECEGWDAYEAGRQDGIEAMLKYDNPAPYVFLTAAELIDCAAAVYQCDPNDVSERDLKFARHVERLTLER